MWHSILTGYPDLLNSGNIYVNTVDPNQRWCCSKIHIKFLNLVLLENLKIHIKFLNLVLLENSHQNFKLVTN